MALTISPVSNLARSNVNTIDALLAGGNNWWHQAGASGSNPSAGAQHDLTYSFTTARPSSSSDARGFAALRSNQQAYIRAAMSYISSVANLKFTEAQAGQGDIQFGSNAQTNSAAYAYYPAGPNGGQVFLANNQSTFAGAWNPGSYEYEVVLHETSHALGLKHPGNYNAGGGGTPGPYLPAAQDNRGNTIMSYYDRPDARTITYSNGRYSVSTVNPLSFGAYDIAALQYVYGAPTSATAGVYSWQTNQKFFQTIYNANPNSRIDLSNQSKSNLVDLRAGNTSSIGERDAYADLPVSAAKFATLTTTVNGRRVKLASVLGTPTYTGSNNLTIAAGSRINGVTGGSGADAVITNGEKDTVSTNDGADQVFISSLSASINGTLIDGGAGVDTVYLKRQSGYSWTVSASNANGTTLDLTQGGNRVAQITLRGVETVRYWDGKSLTATNDTPLVGTTPAASIIALYKSVVAPATGKTVSRRA